MNERKPTAAAMARMPLSELRRLPLSDRLRLDAERCPNIAKHARQPQGYVAWREWVTEKAKTHKQHRCPGCGRYSIWKPLAGSVSRARPGDPHA